MLKTLQVYFISANWFLEPLSLLLAQRGSCGT